MNNWEFKGSLAQPGMNVLTESGILMDAQGYIAEEGITVVLEGGTYAIGATCHREEDMEIRPPHRGTTHRLVSKLAGWEVSW
jgi:hypothetical protein